MEISDLKDKYLAAHEKIRAAKNILLATHERPDGDGLASLCAISHFLSQLGKRQTLFCADPAPEFFSFLPNISQLTFAKNFNFADFDLIIVLDCGSLGRTKLAEEIAGRQKDQFIIEFDHHPKVKDYSDLEIRLAGKSSAAEVLYYFFYYNNLPIDKNIANCLLTGILTDTGNLLFGAVTQETIRIASLMLLSGATFPKITRHTLQNKSLATMKAWGKVLDNLRLNKEYNIAYSVLSLAEIESLKKEYGTDSVFDAATDILNNIDGVKAVIFLREEIPGQIRGSLRTKNNNVDVSCLATFLGGGGHPKASAFRLAGNIIKTKTGWKII
jgi:bifunctional oligoribonuclease and PAP phosphatase NrnA